MLTKKKNETFWVKIDTKGMVLNDPTSFYVYYIEDSTGAASDKVNNFVEVDNLINERYAIVDGPVEVGATEIPFSECTLEKRNSFSDGIGNYYMIAEKTETSIKIKTPIITALNDGIILHEVAKSGFYKAPIVISDVGDYTVCVYHANSDFSSSVSISIVELDLEDLNSKLDDALATQSKKTVAFI